MSQIELSRAATIDIRTIRLHTREHFGLTQSIRLRERFQKILRTLAEAPQSAPLRLEYDPPGKTFRYCFSITSFTIVYEPLPTGIRIARVLHSAQDLVPILERNPGDD